MKNPVINTFAILTISALSFIGCSEMASNATDAEASLKNTVSAAANAEMLLMPCGFDDRNTTANLDNQNGVILAMPSASEPDGLLYIITIPAESQRFTACNMPESLKHDGMKLTFSGEVKEIMPEERWIATPFKLSAVKINE